MRLSTIKQLLHRRAVRVVLLGLSVIAVAAPLLGGGGSGASAATHGGLQTFAGQSSSSYVPGGDAGSQGTGEAGVTGTDEANPYESGSSEAASSSAAAGSTEAEAAQSTQYYVDSEGNYYESVSGGELVPIEGPPSGAPVEQLSEPDASNEAPSVESSGGYAESAPAPEASYSDPAPEPEPEPESSE